MTTHAQIAADARRAYADALMKTADEKAILLDALLSILNVEGAALAGNALPAWRGLDVQWHFEKVRAAIAKATGG